MLSYSSLPYGPVQFHFPFTGLQIRCDVKCIEIVSLKGTDASWACHKNLLKIYFYDAFPNSLCVSFH